MPPGQKCPNCAQHRHYLRDCPHPHVKCDVCGRAGHREEICFKARKEAPNGKLHISSLRMTRNGIHIDLVDEATKKSLFEAMRRHVESQEAQYAKAKVRATARRAEKKNQPEASDEENGTEPPEEDELGIAAVVDAFTLPEVSEVSSEEIGRSKLIGTTKYVDVEIYEQCIPGLLDSGAVVSLLPKTAWDKIPPEQRETLATTEVGSRPISRLGGKLMVRVIADVPICNRSSSSLKIFSLDLNFDDVFAFCRCG